MACITEWASPRMVTRRTRSASDKGSSASEHQIPTRLPQSHERFARGGRVLELGVAMAVGLLAIGGQEVRPARAHVAGHMLYYDGNRIGFRVEGNEKLLVGNLRHSAFGELLVLAKQGERIFQV